MDDYFLAFPIIDNCDFHKCLLFILLTHIFKTLKLLHGESGSGYRVVPKYLTIVVKRLEFDSVRLVTGGTF